MDIVEILVFIQALIPVWGAVATIYGALALPQISDSLLVGAVPYVNFGIGVALIAAALYLEYRRSGLESGADLGRRGKIIFFLGAAYAIQGALIYGTLLVVALVAGAFAVTAAGTGLGAGALLVVAIVLGRRNQEAGRSCECAGDPGCECDPGA
jgi:hypothetical protein